LRVPRSTGPKPGVNESPANSIPFVISSKVETSLAEG
jgi:hypothetical protein